jgi:hypothetical protein
MITQWSLPKGDWLGSPAFIVGGGESVKQIAEPVLRGLPSRGKVIVVNDAFLLVPDAHILYFGDRKWFRWPHTQNDLPQFKGLKITVALGCDSPEFSIKRLYRWNHGALSREPNKVCGRGSGTAALNIAYLMGCNPIYLVGFDMGGRHWHDRHLSQAKPHLYPKRFIPEITKMAAELKKEQVHVFNLSPDSALTCFPMITWQMLDQKRSHAA